MINLDTVFVVGAGASVDYGFPLGEQLTKDISDALNFSGAGGAARELLRTAIEVASRHPDVNLDLQQLFLHARTLQAALATASSIDAFLENHAGNPYFELLGKMAIAACLISAERRSELRPLRFGERLDLAKVGKSWLARLFTTVMAPGVSKSSVEQIFEHVSFVVFNYDRCIEHYFEQAIASHFMLDLPKAATIVRQHLRIVHPYGHLGELGGTNSNVSFGHDYQPGTHPAGDAVYNMSRRLLTFTESKKAEGAEAQEVIGKARRLVFLGFGFGEQNVALLRARDTGSQLVRATVMGLSKSNQRQVAHRITQIIRRPPVFSAGIELYDCDCATLINNEQMFLTRSG